MNCIPFSRPSKALALASALALTACAGPQGSCANYSLTHASGEQHRFRVPLRWIDSGYMKHLEGEVDRFYVSIPYEVFRPAGTPLDNWAVGSDVDLMVAAPRSGWNESILIGDPTRFRTIIDPLLPGLKERRSLDVYGAISQRIFQGTKPVEGLLFIDCPSSSLQSVSYCELYGSTSASVRYSVFIPVTQLRYFRQFMRQAVRVLEHLEVPANGSETLPPTCPAPSLSSHDDPAVVATDLRGNRPLTGPHA